MTQLDTVLNEGLLPEGYYALAEQHMGHPIADVLTLHASTAPPTPPLPLPPDTGGIALAEAPPKVQRRHTVEPAALIRARDYATRCGGLHPLTTDAREFSGASVRAASSVLDWPAEPTRDWRRGLLAGLFDADGSDEGGTLRLIPDVGHMIHYAVPQQVVEAISVAADRRAAVHGSAVASPPSLHPVSNLAT